MAQVPPIIRTSRKKRHIAVAVVLMSLFGFVIWVGFASQTPARPAFLEGFLYSEFDTGFGATLTFRVPKSSGHQVARDLARHYGVDVSEYSQNHLHFQTLKRVNCTAGFRARGRTRVSMVTSAANCALVDADTSALSEPERHVSVLIFEHNSAGRIMDTLLPSPIIHRPRSR
ncbi:MAG: hypothetical protein ABL962_11980 [Fimbriimonadaceae bacterium]